jgi:hypothetical protein
MKNFLKTLWLTTVISLSSCNGYNDTKWWVEKNAQESITGVMNDKKEIVDDQTHRLLWLLEEGEFTSWTWAIKITKEKKWNDEIIIIAEEKNNITKTVEYNLMTRDYTGQQIYKNEKTDKPFITWWMTHEDCIDLIKELTNQPLG